MKLIDLTCNKCGAQLKVNAELSKCMCQYCGNEMLIDQEIIHHKIDNAFDAGYQAELGRIKAQEDIKRQQEEVRIADRNRLFNTPQAHEYAKYYGHELGSDLENFLRDKLKSDWQLAYEYNNGISIEDIYKQKQEKVLQIQQEWENKRNQQWQQYIKASEDGAILYIIAIILAIISMITCMCIPYVPSIVCCIIAIMLVIYTIKKNKRIKISLVIAMVLLVFVGFSNMILSCASDYYKDLYTEFVTSSDYEE